MSVMRYSLVLIVAAALVAVSFLAKVFTYPTVAVLGAGSQCADTTPGTGNPNKVKFISCGGFL